MKTSHNHRDLNPAEARTDVEGLYQDGPVIRTYKGYFVDLAAPKPHTIDITDIAHALSNIPRFGGHTSRPYSVAAHCVNCAMRVAPEHRLAALMHDAAEAYMGDMVAPLKRRLPDFITMEKRLDRVIAQKFGYPYPFPHEVKLADREMLEREWQLLMKLQYGTTLHYSGHTWKHDKQAFLRAYRDIMDKKPIRL